MAAAALAPTMTARMASQARAVERAAFTHRKIMELAPRFGLPVAVLDASPAAIEALHRAARSFEPHPALDAGRTIVHIQGGEHA